MATTSTCCDGTSGTRPPTWSTSTRLSIPTPTTTSCLRRRTAPRDTWRWDEAAARVFAETVDQGGRVADVLLAFERFLGTNDMLAYLAMMAPRLVEFRRVLKPTGSLYLHCDPTASHYLKLLLEPVFGPEHFRNEIVWKRTTAHSSAKKFAPIHDVILYSGNAQAQAA